MRYSSAHRPSFLPQSFAVPAPLLPGAPSRAQKPPGRGLLFPVIHGSVLHEPVVPAIRFRVIRHRSTIPEFISGTFLVIPVLCTVPFLSPNTLFSCNYIALPWPPPPFPMMPRCPPNASSSPAVAVLPILPVPAHGDSHKWPQRWAPLCPFGAREPVWPRRSDRLPAPWPSRSFAFPRFRVRPTTLGFPHNSHAGARAPFCLITPSSSIIPFLPLLPPARPTPPCLLPNSPFLSSCFQFCFLSQFRIFVLSEIQVSYHIPSPKFLLFPPSFLFAP